MAPSLARSCSLAAAALLLSAAPTAAMAAPVWVGDFETGDVSQWNNALNGEHISVVDDPTIQGAHAGHIQLTNDAVWSNGLKRVELHHSPDDGRTDEGKELYFGWSFFLPQTLTTDPTQQIGYWETDQSYHQLMAFEVSGEHLSFSTRYPNNNVQWEADGMATANTWHRIAMHIFWSQDPDQGYVDVWYDGAKVVDHGGAQTLFDTNSAFTQVGLLRGQIEFQDSPIIILDDAVEGDSLADVHPDLPGEGGGGAGATSSSASVTSATATAAGSGVTSGAGATTGSGGAGGGGGSGSKDDGGCTVRSSASSDHDLLALGVAATAIALGRRRLRRRG